jgi:murein DD-endopeptidase MepM/ murein hydrolase activator NlpD
MKRSRNFKRAVLITGVVCLMLLTAAFIFFFYSTAVTNKTDPYLYSLPFEAGSSHRVVQGYGGLFSHKHIAAIDFEMPVGTPVCAARSGMVWRFKDDSNDGGFLPDNKNKANYIIIQHDDGSFGCYWHLKQYGVIVKSGHVEEGQVIGYSGATGQVIRPHLHFSVKSKLNYEMDSFRKTLFKTVSGNNFLKNGRIYKKPETPQ